MSQFKTLARLIQALAVVQLAVAGSALMAAEPCLLRSTVQDGSQNHVEVLLEVGGDLKLAEAGKIKSLKMSVVGKLSYDEKRLNAKFDTPDPRGSALHPGRSHDQGRKRPAQAKIARRPRS